MLQELLTVTHSIGDERDLAGRILGGEIVVLRHGLQQLDVFDTIVGRTLDGIRSSAGRDIAQKVEHHGVERIHEWIDASELPALTDAVYASLTPLTRQVLNQIVPRVFPECGTYYYERTPSVRFHIPYDLTVNHQRAFNKFAGAHGQGKIQAHGPHRDPWVDCPDNAINVWSAVGPVQRGNGLTVFADDYRTPFAFRGGYIDGRARLHRPLDFELAPGDVVLFHSDHLHGSELNRTTQTRYVVSFRVTFDKPHYPFGHYHSYLHGGLAGGPFYPLASIPQNLQLSFLKYQFRRLRQKLGGGPKMSGTDRGMERRPDPQPRPEQGASIELSDLPVGSVRAVSQKACVARLEENEFMAVSRRCPHMGGDLGSGWTDSNQIVCPLHNLRFDPQTGASSCRSLPVLQRYVCERRGNRIVVRSNDTDMQQAGDRGLADRIDSQPLPS